MIITLRKLPIFASLAGLAVLLGFGLTLGAQKEERRPRAKAEQKPVPSVQPPRPAPLPVSPPQPPMASFQSPVTEIRLDNGLKVLLQEVHTTPLVSVGCWYRVGSKDDPITATGLSHWLEHVTFRGTETHPGAQLTNLLAEAGGAWNGYTFLDQTAFFETIVSPSLEEMLKMEASRMTGVLFDPKAVEQEREMVAAELRRVESDPRVLLDTDVAAAAFRLNPYRWPSTGWLSQLEAISQDQLLRHYRQYYAPNNAILVLVGAFEARNAQSLIQRYFGEIPRQPEPPQVSVKEPEPRGERRVKLVHEAVPPCLQLAYWAPDILNDDFYAMLILDAVLNGAKGINVWSTPWDTPARKSSRLYKALVAQDLATKIQSQLIPTQGSYLYRLTLTLPDAFQFQPAEEAAIEQLERLKNYELTDLELAKARNELITREFLDQDSVSKRAHQLGYFESIASFKLLNDFELKIARVSKEDLRRVAIRYFSDAARTVGWLVPAPKKQVIEVEKLSASCGVGGVECVESPESTVAEENLHQGLFATKKERNLGGPAARNHTGGAFPGSRLFSRPTFRLDDSIFSRHSSFGKLFSGSFSVSAANLPHPADGSLTLKPQRKTLANGLTVIVAENKFSPAVAIVASMKAGAMRETDPQAGIANLTARLLDRGTISRNIFQLADAFDSLGADLYLDTDYLSATATVRGLSKDVPAFLQLLGEMLQTPAFPPAELENVRNEVLDDLREQAGDLRLVAERGLRERIYPQGHPFRRMILGTIPSVERVRLADVTAFYKRYYRPDQCVLSIAGDIRPEAAFDAAERVFSRWSSAGSSEPFSIAAASAGLGAGNQWIQAKDKALCEVILGMPGISIRHPDYYALLILNHIFSQAGASGRLGRRLRDAEGLPAMVRSEFDANLAEGPFVVRTAVNPARVEQAVELIRQEAHKIKELGVTEEEAASAKKALIHSFPVHLESNESIARELLAMELYLLGEDYLQRYPDLIGSVSLGSLRNCARTQFAFERAALVIAGHQPKH